MPVSYGHCAENMTVGFQSDKQALTFDRGAESNCFKAEVDHRRVLFQRQRFVGANDDLPRFEYRCGGQGRSERCRVVPVGENKFAWAGGMILIGDEQPGSVDRRIEDRSRGLRMQYACGDSKR